MLQTVSDAPMFSLVQVPGSYSSIPVCCCTVVGTCTSTSYKYLYTCSQYFFYVLWYPGWTMKSAIPGTRYKYKCTNFFRLTTPRISHMGIFHYLFSLCYIHHYLAWNRLGTIVSYFLAEACPRIYEFEFCCWQILNLILFSRYFTDSRRVSCVIIRLRVSRS